MKSTTRLLPVSLSEQGVPAQNTASLSRRSVVALGGAMTMLAACGGGGIVPTQGVAQRSLSSDFASRKAVAYAPFRTANRNTEVVTSANILQDLQLLVTGGFTLIRLFDSSDSVSKLVLQTIAANNLNIKVMLGVWIAANQRAANEADVARGIALANTFRSSVVAVSVGNETMVSWSTYKVPVSEMVGYINTVRSGITQPVTTDDNWAFFANVAGEQNPKSVLNAIDFVSMHTYPLLDTVYVANKWNWQQTAVAANARATAMMDAAIGSAQQDFAAVRAHMSREGLAAMPIVMGETGWKAVASGNENMRAHPVNQKMYLDRLSAWLASAAAKPQAIFYFEAFDEPWKQADDKWGLFNVNRQARYVVQSLYPAGIWEAGTYTTADALYFIPTVSNGVIAANRYTVFADTAVSGEAKPTEIPLWVGWNSPATAYAGENTSTFALGDGPKSMEITPAPATWGWGLIAALVSTSDDLSQFAVSGRLNFSINTTYPGKLEFGFLTGTTTAGSAYDVYLAVDPASNTYGYVNDGTWRTVSIPISAITPRGAMAFGMTDASKSKLDLTKVTNPLVIADRYATTGKANGFGNTTKIYLDNVYWSK